MIVLREIVDWVYDKFHGNVEPILPYFLIVFTILFCYFYSMYLLYRVETRFLVSEKVQVKLNAENPIAHWSYVGSAILFFLLALYIYYRIAKSPADEDTGIFPRAFFMAVLFAPLFVLTFLFVVIYRATVIPFAQTPHLMRCVLAFSILIYLCVLPLYLFSGDKVKLSMMNMYLLGFFGFLLATNLTYFAYQVAHVTEQMEKDRFDTLSKVCLLGTRGTVETEPYIKPKQKCVCTEGFDCVPEHYTCLKERFESESGQEEDEREDAEEIEGFENEEKEQETPADDLKRNQVGIPIQYYNNNLQKYDDLCIRDFYYMGSFYSYLANTPDYGIPEIPALRGVVKDFRTRFVHLDIYEGGGEGRPVVRCEVMADKATPLSLEECCQILRQDGFYNRENTPPLFLYLSFHKIRSKKTYQKVYGILQSYFKNMLIDKLYGFNERQHQSSLAELPIQEALGKVILLTDTYPTYTLLDEILNCNVKDPKSSVQLREYKASYIQYDEKGLLLDYNEKDLIEEQKHKMFLYYTLPNKNYADNAKVQSKAGIFNPDTSDIFQYGGQMGLMYVYVPDSNMVECLDYFKESGEQMVLKEPSLRYIRDVNPYVVPESVTKDMTDSMGTENVIQELRSFDLKFSA